MQGHKADQYQYQELEPSCPDNTYTSSYVSLY